MEPNKKEDYEKPLTDSEKDEEIRKLKEELIYHRIRESHLRWKESSLI